MAQTTFDIDEKTLQVIADLKQRFNVKTNAQVIRRALALARVAAANTDIDDTVTILGPEKRETRVILSD